MRFPLFKYLLQTLLSPFGIAVAEMECVKIPLKVQVPFYLIKKKNFFTIVLDLHGAVFCKHHI